MTRVHVIGERGGGKLINSAYIRLHLPLQKLADENLIDLSLGTDYDHHKNSDIIIVERSWYDGSDVMQAKRLVSLVRENGKKLIYETDDNLLDIPYIPLDCKGAIRILARNADVVTVSTHELKRRMERFNRNIRVIPNFLDSRLFEERRGVFHPNPVITIGYMGTVTHQKDFQMIKLTLMRVLKKFQSKVRLEIIGALENTETIRSMPHTQVKKLKGVNDYFSYWQWMNKNCFWDIGVAPLKLDDFTRCKSDIKYLDYSALGIAGVYSKHPSYENTVKHRETGLLADNTCDAWQESIEELVRTPELRRDFRNAAQEDLWENRLLQNGADMWWSLIQEIARV